MAQISRGQKNRESSFGFLIQTLGRRLDVTMRERLKEVDIDVKIFANLMLLYEADGVNQRQLGKKLDFPEYYTSRNVDALVKAGFAERRPDPNSRRSFLIYLTEKGRKKAAQLPKIIAETNELHLKRLTLKERKDVVALLQKTVGIETTS
ncbi:MAG: MarR family transcriptional regulator [Alphaproteobacteria bacterium]|nr:MarR family transcriptional regulator [Alphaproteobacteria bacterium]